MIILNLRPGGKTKKGNSPSTWNSYSGNHDGLLNTKFLQVQQEMSNQHDCMQHQSTNQHFSSLNEFCIYTVHICESTYRHSLDEYTMLTIHAALRGTIYIHVCPHLFLKQLRGPTFHFHVKSNIALCPSILLHMFTNMLTKEIQKSALRHYRKQLRAVIPSQGGTTKY